MSDIEDYVSVAEYAALHGVNTETIKKRCQRKGFETARKIGRNWVLNKTEPFIDKRIVTGKYKKTESEK